VGDTVIHREVIGQARDWLAEAASVAVLTGAGISAGERHSHFSAVRAVCGKNYGPKIWPQPEAFARDPQLVWEWYNWRAS